jgi:hypothetical protein
MVIRHLTWQRIPSEKADQIHFCPTIIPADLLNVKLWFNDEKVDGETTFKFDLTAHSEPRAKVRKTHHRYGSLDDSSFRRTDIVESQMCGQEVQ